MKTLTMTILVLFLAGCANVTPRDQRVAAKDSLCDSRGIGSNDCKVVLIR